MKGRIKQRKLLINNEECIEEEAPLFIKTNLVQLGHSDSAAATVNESTLLAAPPLHHLNPDNCALLLDYDTPETQSLTLLERARLFVSLKYGSQHRTVKEMFNAFKFKTNRHLMLNQPLPPKGLLINICKT